MPVTASLSDANPYGIAVPAAYGVATNIHSDLTTSNGTLNTPAVTVYYAFWASEAAYHAGSVAGTHLTVPGPLDVSSANLATAIDALMLSGVQALPYVLSASIINT